MTNLFFLDSNVAENEDDLEDGEIPSDEDDEPTVATQAPPPVVAHKQPIGESAKLSSKQDSPKQKSFESSKFSKSKKSSGTSGSGGVSSKQQDRFSKYKNPSEDWAGDVEKAIRAMLEEQERSKAQHDSTNSSSKSKSKSSRNKNRKRARDEKDDERAKEQKVCFPFLFFFPLIPLVKISENRSESLNFSENLENFSEFIVHFKFFREIHLSLN